MLIQRYSVSMWPRVRGHDPFIVRGPKWSLAPTIVRAFDDLPHDAAGRLAIAEVLLDERIVSAAWSVVEGSLPRTERRSHAIEYFARTEIPIPPGVCGKNWKQTLVELFQVVPDLSHYRWYLSPDSIELEVS